jgi:hypothetical protein
MHAILKKTAMFNKPKFKDKYLLLTQTVNKGFFTK